MDPRWNGRQQLRRYVSIPLAQIAALLLVALLADVRPVRAADRVEFHVPAGDAAKTLNEFSRQANLQLLFDFDTVRGRLTQAVDGWFEPRDALRRLLGDSGLTFTLVNDRTLAVTLPRAAANGSRSRQRKLNKQTVT